MTVNGYEIGPKADLSKADLSLAILSGADLSGADLSKAVLSEANLRGADLSKADLSGAKGIYQAGPMATSGRMLYAVNHETHLMVQAGCFWGTINELESAVKADHNDPMYLLAIEYFRGIEKLYCNPKS